MQVWYSEWRIGDDADTEFSVGDRVRMDVMPFEHGEALATLLRGAGIERVRHELFDSDDADPFITVQGRIDGLCEYRVWRQSVNGERTVQAEALFPVSSTRGQYERAGHGGEVEAYVLSIAEDHPASQQQIEALAAAYVLVNERQKRWQALQALGAEWRADPYR